MAKKVTRKLYPAGPTLIPPAGGPIPNWSRAKAMKQIQLAEAARREDQYRRWLAAQRGLSLDLAGAGIEILELEASF